MTTNTARNFALQLGALASLYLSLSFLLVLLFGLINILFPDPAVEGYWAIESAQSSIRIGIAMTVVFFPTYLILTRTVNRTRRNEQEGAYLTLTKWLIYLSLLVGGGVLLGDLVAVIMTFLEGDLTARFILKALAVLVVVGGAFYYYIKDAQSYWVTHEKESIMYGGVMALVVLAAVVLGSMNIATPSEVREQRIDDQQVSDLQNIQWRIEEFIFSNDRLPESLDEAFVTEVPAAPEGREAYSYQLSDNGFELCATFAQPSRGNDFEFARPPRVDPNAVIQNAFVWEHPAGRYCFERSVNLPDNASE